MGFIDKIFGDPNVKIIAAMQPIIDKINSLEAGFEKMSDEELRGVTAGFRERLGIKVDSAESSGSFRRRSAPPQDDSGALDKLLPEAFAAVREAAKRVLGQRHYDVQIIGGLVLHRGQIAEMKTGEGKTLVATLPLYLNALAGRGAQLITVNDYLSSVGAGWMAPVYYALGMSTGVIIHDSALIYDPDYIDDSQYDKRLKHFRPVERREAYAADITYGTNNEFGFDYLRDNMVPSMDRMVQRDLYYTIVDEVDSILIDEARTPLIISAPAEESTDKYFKFAQLVKRLRENEDYNVDEKMRAATLSEGGITRMEKWLGVDNIYTEGGVSDVHHIEQALKAHTLFKLDKDYVVKDGEIIIVDEFTGRLMQGRRYSEGLHQAIEAKEGVKVQRESQTLATITFQNYFRMYEKLAGMTGTALTEAEEFSKIYSLETVSIPTNKPCVRKDKNDLIYRTEIGKFKAVIEDIKERSERGQPVLVGTVSIEKNELLAGMMERSGLRPNVLNAKNHEKEAKFIADAGKPGSITLATNMAGRGVDIMLGGTEPSFAPRSGATEGKPTGVEEKTMGEISDVVGMDGEFSNSSPVDQADSTALRGHEVIGSEQVGSTALPSVGTIEPAVNDNTESEEHKQWRKDRERVLELGGLHVIGTERHEARRIDNQLRGRAGRQGDNGSSQFFVSMEDDLMRIFGGDRMKSIMTTLRVPEDMPIENRLISRSIESAQIKVEGNNFDIRKHLVEYDDVINKHREAIYRKRREALERAREGSRGLERAEEGEKADGANAAIDSRKEIADSRYSFAESSDGKQSGINTIPDGQTVSESEIRNTKSPSIAEAKAGKEIRNPKSLSIAEARAGKEIRNQMSLSDIILEMVENEIEQVVSFHTAAERIPDWNLEEIYQVTSTIFPVEEKLKGDLSEFTRNDNHKLDIARARTTIIEHLVGLAKDKYKLIITKTKEAGINWPEIEKSVLIRSIDSLWVEHLEAMSSVRQGIGLRGYGQRDPLLEYKKEAYRLFNELNNLINQDVVYSIYKIASAAQTNAEQRFSAPSLADRATQFSAPSKVMDSSTASFSGYKQAAAASGSSTRGGGQGAVDKNTDLVRQKVIDSSGNKVGRNDPCPCGSGKKFKKCCG